MKRWWLGLIMLSLTAIAGCQSPCEQLTDRICARRGVDNDQCMRWEQRTKHSSAETCSHALKMLDREKIR